MKILRLSLWAILLHASGSITQASEVPVRCPAEIASALKSARPGDTLVMADGVWNDADILFEGEGAEGRPITLRAQTPGKVSLTGHSLLRIAGRHLVVEGLCFRDGFLEKGDLVEFRGHSSRRASDSRLTNCAFMDYNPPDKRTNYKWVSIHGARNRVDHCYFTGQTHTGNMMVVWFATPADGTHLVDHNHFANKPRLGWNGGEVIRIGDSRTSMHVSRTVVEHNYFEACNGEVEIISNKSCENVYRYNTFVNCEGALTLRHGNRCTVEGNFFFGKHKRLTGGVRVIGEEHRVFNNYFCELGGDKARSAVSFMDGIVNSPLDGYFQVKNALITFNTFVDCASAISIGISHEGGTLPPENCVFANNVVVGKKGPLVQLLEPAAKLAWQGNIMFGAEVGIPSTPGIKVADPRLALGGGLWRPAKDGPAVGAAEGDFPFITEDIEGCPRGARKDVGCFQASGAPPTRRPLTPADVGPDWMREGRQ